MVCLWECLMCGMGMSGKLWTCKPCISDWKVVTISYVWKTQHKHSICQLSQLMFSMRDKMISGLEGLSVRMLDVRHGHGWEYLDQYALRILLESSNLKNRKRCLWKTKINLLRFCRLYFRFIIRVRAKAKKWCHIFLSTWHFVQLYANCFWMCNELFW